MKENRLGGVTKPVDREYLVESDKPDWVQPEGARHREGSTEEGLASLSAEIEDALGKPMSEAEIKELKGQYRQESVPRRAAIRSSLRTVIFETVAEAFDGCVPEGEIDLVLRIWQERYGRVEVEAYAHNFDAEPAPAASPMTIDGKYVKPLFLSPGQEKPEAAVVLWDVDKESTPGNPFEG